MIYCANCGSQLQDDAAFCPECGTKTEKEVAVTPPLPPQTVTEANTTAPPATTQTAIAQPPVAEAPPPPKQYCRNCGKEVAAGAFACMGCGLPPMKASNYCNSCGANSHPDAVICIKCGIKLTNKSGSNNSANTNITKVYCRNCGKEVLPGAVACVSCGLPPAKGKSFCNSCGSSTNSEAVVCIKCGVKLGTSSSSFSSSATSSVGINTENPGIKTAAFWGSILVFAGFFMPWIKFIGSFNGANIAKFISDSGESESGYALLFYLLPVSAAIFFVSVLMQKVSQFAMGVRFVPVALITIGIILIISESKGGGYDDEDFLGGGGGDFFQMLGIGLIATVVGAIMMCFYTPKK